MWDFLVIFGKWTLVGMLFSTVVGAAKYLRDKKRKKSPLLIAGLILWLILGSVVFFIAFCWARA